MTFEMQQLYIFITVSHSINAIMMHSDEMGFGFPTVSASMQ
jgi:hypothetical protein